jgi:hypothetical protein
LRKRLCFPYSKPQKALTAQTFQIDPFDIMLHATEVGVRALQSRIAGWLSTLSGPARFVSYQQPAELEDKIERVKAEAHHLAETEPVNPRVELLTEYRRFYETLQHEADYQRASSFMVVWSDDHPRALANRMSAALDTPVHPIEALPPLFEGRYTLKNAPFWHLAPVGRPGGRLLWAILTTYEFLPSSWNFFRPLAPLLSFNFPLAIDIPKTFDRSEGIDAVEQTVLAYTVHLSSARGVLRGEAVGGAYPFFYDSWNDAHGNPEKRASHEVWVGVPGYGKTFACNTYLSREYIEHAIPFELLEPMGHGAHLARTLGLPWFVCSA